MVVVDTSVWVDYFAGRANLQTEWLHVAFGEVKVGITDLILCELLQGVRDDAGFTRIRRRLALLPVVESGGEAIAVASAANYRSLRAAGYTVRTTVDCFIATVCLVEGHALLHRDRDFDAFERYLGLEVIHP